MYHKKVQCKVCGEATRFCYDMWVNGLEITHFCKTCRRKVKTALEVIRDIGLTTTKPPA